MIFSAYERWSLYKSDLCVAVRNITGPVLNVAWASGDNDLNLFFFRWNISVICPKLLKNYLSSFVFGHFLTELTLVISKQIWSITDKLPIKNREFWIHFASISTDRTVRAVRARRASVSNPSRSVVMTTTSGRRREPNRNVLRSARLPMKANRLINLSPRTSPNPFINSNPFINPNLNLNPNPLINLSPRTSPNPFINPNLNQHIRRNQNTSKSQRTIKLMSPLLVATNTMPTPTKVWE